MTYNVEVATQEIRLFSSPYSTPCENSLQLTSHFEGSPQRLSHFTPLESGHCGTALQSNTCKGSSCHFMEPKTHQWQSCYSQHGSLPPAPGQVSLAGSDAAAMWRTLESTEHAQCGTPLEPCLRQEQPTDSWGVYMHFSSSYKHERLCLEGREGTRNACLLPEMCPFISVCEELGKGVSCDG